MPEGIGYNEDKKKNNVDPKGDEPIRPDDPAQPIQISAANGVDAAVRQEELVKEYLGEFSRWETWRKPYENLWNEVYRLYLSVLQSFKTPTRAKIFIPVTFQVIEAALPKLLNVIVAQREFFEVIPDEDVEREREVAGRIKKLILHQLDKAKFVVKFVDFLKQLLLYGTSYMYIYWKVKREWVWTRKPIREDVSFLGFRLGSRIVRWEEKKEYVVTERRPELEILDVLDVYPDPMAQDEDQGKAVWIRTWADVDELKEMGKGKYPIYANVDNPELATGKAASGTYSEVRQQRFGARGQTDPTIASNKVELLARWGKCDLDGDGIKEETVFIIANRRVLLQAKPNQFHHQKRPLIRGTLFPVPMEWFGIGLIEPVIPLQHELNTVRRQRLDNINLILNRMWKVSTLADVDLETLVSSPNGVVLTDDMGAVEALETQDVTQSSYNDASIIQADIENVTAPRSVQGIPESGRLGRTARGAQLIITQALEKFGTAARLTEETAIKRMLEMWQALNMQFIDSDDTLRNPRLYGGLFEPEVTVEDIRAQVRFRLTGSSELIDKEGKINQIISFFGIFKDFVAPETITVLMRKVWELMGFDKKEISSVSAVLPQPGAVTSQAGPTAEQNAEASVAGQVAQNGAAGLISAPGARPGATPGRV
jgi:hypothetical protein